MARFAEPETETSRVPARTGVRVLCLGNELLADDAFGFEVAKRISRMRPAEIEIACSCASGFGLTEHVTECATLVIVDSIHTGATPGTIHVIDSEALSAVAAESPHQVGIMEVLKAAEMLGLSVPQRVAIYAVEAADVTTIGGPMDARVQDAIEIIVEKIARAFGTSPPRTDASGRDVPQALANN